MYIFTISLFRDPFKFSCQFEGADPDHPAKLRSLDLFINNEPVDGEYFFAPAPLFFVLIPPYNEHRFFRACFKMAF